MARSDYINYYYYKHNVLIVLFIKWFYSLLCNSAKYQAIVDEAP